MTEQAALTPGLAEAARRAPHSAAVFLPHGPAGRGAAGWRPVTYDQLWRRTKAIAGGLGAIGVAPGERVALLVPPSEDFFALMLGLLEAGAVPVLVDPGIGRQHLAQCLDEADLAGFIGTPKAHAARLVLRWARGARHHIVTGSSAGPRAFTISVPPAMRRRGAPARPPGRRPLSLAMVERFGRGRPAAGPVDGTAAIIFTSGSTGPPKGVEYTHDNFAGQIAALRELYGLGPDDVHLATFPPFALFGPALGMPTVVPRMDPTRPARVDPRNIVEPLEAFRTTVMFGSPALLDTVSRWAMHHGVRLEGLRLVMSAGAPVSLRIVTAMASILDDDARLVTPYGATEALPVTSVDHRALLEGQSGSDRGEPGIGVCVGTPAPGARVGIMRITDDPVTRLSDDDLLPSGEMGEIVVSGPMVTASYHARPAATAAAKTRWNGALAHRMGDLGYIDGDGRLWFCGRKVHLVTTADEAIAPVPIEVVFNAHPWVSRSALIGVGPAGWQQPCVCIELGPNAPSPAVALADLRRLAAQHERTRRVVDIRIHPGFPVDIRHNAKINYGKLVEWWQAR